MVLIEVKRENNPLFIVETTLDTSLSEVSTHCGHLYNIKIRFELMAYVLKQLAEHGVMRPVSEQGIDEVRLDSVQIAALKNDTRFDYNPDPLGQRDGRAPLGQVKENLFQAAARCESVFATAKVENREVLNVDEIEECLDFTRGSVTIAYPMGLPEHEPLAGLLEDPGHWTPESMETQPINVDTCVLWFAGKQLSRASTLKQCTKTRHENTKIIAKITHADQGPPGREQAVSDETQKRLMAMYYKKEQEMKKMELDQSLSGNAPWADSNSFKRSLYGNSSGPGNSLRFR
ncbi:hypothetical protein PCE1_003526 [Barthelona sp. PCE]